MSASLNPNKALIFRIVHKDNVPWILENGLHCRSSDTFDPNYISIGNSSLIEMREHRQVPISPGGTLADYIPFYFTPYSIMMYNIKTGYGSVTRRKNSDIIIMVSSLHHLSGLGIPFIYTNQHAYPVTAEYYDSLTDLGNIDWELLQSKDFRHDPEDPGKKERYQAEALIHRHLPLSGLIGMVTYDEATSEEMRDLCAQTQVPLEVIARQGWYF